jgi:anti-sigma regulatory factor (Ser/Thr protein kinase)
MTTWCREFPGRPESAGAARHWVTLCLAGCPAAGDAGLCVTELVTNAVVHSRSRLPGGTVRVRLHADAGVQVRIEVRDDGPFRDRAGAATGRAAAVTELPAGGRGLGIVHALSGGNAGSDGNGLHWAGLHWGPLPAGLPAEPEPWAVRWLAVMERAGWRCECSGQCGRAGHCCPIGHAPGYPLHVVSAVPAAAATLPAGSLLALCASCRAGAERAARAAAAAVPQDGAMFTAVPGGAR